MIKRELQAIPTIDIGGRWCPTFFVRRGSGDTAGESAALRSLLDGIGDGESVLIYPEGTRATAKKIARAKEIIAERQPEVSPLADRLQNVLPPRLGGPLELLDEAAGGGSTSSSAATSASTASSTSATSGPAASSGRRSRCASGAAPQAEIPTTEQERIEWLYEHWQELDEWVGEKRGV